MKNAWLKPQFETGSMVALLLLLVAVLLQPDTLTSNDGLSYLGVHWRSAIAFALSLMVFGATLIEAMRRLAASYSIPLFNRLALIMVVCLVGLIITPYSLSTGVHVMHDVLGSTLFITQLGVAIYLVYRKYLLADLILIAVQVAAGLAALISLPDIWRLEVAGQVIFQIAFVAIVWRRLDLVKPPASQSSTSPAPSKS